MTKKYEVRSSIDGNVAFDSDSVAESARVWRTTPRIAARLIARDNADSLIDETMTIHEVVA